MVPLQTTEEGRLRIAQSICMRASSHNESKPPFEPRVVYEDNHLLALVKPHGMPTQPDKSGDLCLLDWGKQYLKDRYHKPGDVFLGLLHRLDRPTGGLVLFARTSKAASRMSAAFREHRVLKTYLAICRGLPEPPEACLIHHLKRLPGVNRMVALGKPKTGSQRAELSYRTLGATKRSEIWSLLEVKPTTGRRHQIRVQLARQNNPLLNDQKYTEGGSESGQIVGQIGLWAWQLRVPHPTRDQNLDLRTDPQTGDAPFWGSFVHLLPEG